MASVWAELKRRNVVKVAVAYAIVGWLLIEVVATLLPTFEAPLWAVQTITVVIILGFPLAVVLAWAFQFTPQGLIRDKGIEADQQAAATPDVTEQSVAVLPFVDMSPDKDQEYFSDGIAEELLNQLSKLRGLHVAGRTSSFSFKNKDDNLQQIAEKLHVAHILEGSVRKAGNRIRITAQLIKASDGYHLWSETFDRDLDDVFAIQDETAKAVADALSVALGVGQSDLGAGGTRNFEAYDAFLEGRSLRYKEGRGNYTNAIELFERAVRLDPDFANAWGELAFAYQIAAAVFISDKAEEMTAKMVEATTRAVNIAPDSVVGLRATAMHEWRNNRNWQAAERQLRRAIDLAPADFFVVYDYGVFLLNVGRAREALQYLQRAFKSEPLAVNAARLVAHAYEISGDFDKALKQYRLASSMPGDLTLVHGATMTLAMAIGDHDLVRELSTTLQMDLENWGLPPAHRELSRTMQPLLESPEQGIAELRRMHQDPNFDIPGTASVLSSYASAFGDHELALESLQRTLAFQIFSPFLLWRPIHKEMRRLPGFKDLVRELGLPDYWRGTGNWGDFCRPAGDDDFECI